MNVSKEIKIIRELLNLTQEEFSKIIGVTFETINRWENSYQITDEKNINKIYDFAYKKGIYLNQIYEHILKEEVDLNNQRLLFHGAKKSIDFPIDLKHSKKNNDFGIGFYLGETFEQASTYIYNNESRYVYAFSLSMNNLKVVEFNVNKEWMLAISYYRGWLDDYCENEIINGIISKVDNADIIIAPIADNRMFDLITEFVDGGITDLQCEHALAATNLGKQYVIKNEQTLNNLNLVKECFVSNFEKEMYLNKRLDFNKHNLNKVKVARIEYRGKGQYIDEILK